ncbi:MAG: N-acetyltransferase family protein [Halobacteria archaeon]
MEVRAATPEDRERVLEFTKDTWAKEGEGAGGWDFIPGVWDRWMEKQDEGKGTVLVADDGGEPVGIVRATAYLTGEAWMEGLRVAESHRNEGVGTLLTERALEYMKEAGARVARVMTFSWNEPALQILMDTGFERTAEFRFARAFGFPYGTKLGAANFDSSLYAIRDTEAYDDMNGLYVTDDWQMLEIPDRYSDFLSGVDVLAWEADDDIRAILICSGKRDRITGDQDRTELVFGFVWMEPKYAGDVALDVRAEAREREAEDALVFMPDRDDYVNSFEQAGFDFSDVDYVFEKPLVD